MDCPNICKVIHWGPPSDVESHIQETGRVGRDGMLLCITQIQILVGKQLMTT